MNYGEHQAQRSAAEIKTLTVTIHLIFMVNTCQMSVKCFLLRKKHKISKLGKHQSDHNLQVQLQLSLSSDTKNPLLLSPIGSTHSVIPQDSNF